MKLKIVSLLLLLVPFILIFSQEKFEKEYRVKSSEVPRKSIELIKAWNFNKKIKWYAEESNDGKTFEAKTWYNSHKYSIEFSEKGVLIDVEKRVKFSELSKAMQQKVKKSLSKKFLKYNIQKIQIQYSGEESEIYAKVFRAKKKETTALLNYELIVKGKKEKKFKVYELLINKEGEVEKEFSIKSFNSINLEF